MDQMLADPFEAAQKVAQFGPKSFGGVGVDFPDPVALVVPRPFFDTVADGSVVQHFGVHLEVCLAFVAITSARFDTMLLRGIDHAKVQNSYLGT